MGYVVKLGERPGEKEKTGKDAKSGAKAAAGGPGALEVTPQMMWIGGGALALIAVIAALVMMFGRGPGTAAGYVDAVPAGSPPGSYAGYEGSAMPGGEMMQPGMDPNMAQPGMQPGMQQPGMMQPGDPSYNASLAPAHNMSVPTNQSGVVDPSGKINYDLMQERNLDSGELVAPGGGR